MQQSQGGLVSKSKSSSFLPFNSSKLEISGTRRQRLQLLLKAFGILNQQISPKSLTESPHQGRRTKYLKDFICHRVEIECQTKGSFSRPCCRYKMLQICQIGSQISNHSVRSFKLTELFVSAPAKKFQRKCWCLVLGWSNSREFIMNVHLMLAEEE